MTVEQRAGRLLVALAVFLGLLVLAPAPVAAAGPPSTPDDAGASPEANDDVLAPIIIEASDPAIDVDDPALIAEIRALNDDFEPGVTRSVAEPVMSWPSASVVNSGMSVVFDAAHTPPANVQAVILAAAQDWDEALATSPAGPVQIAVAWRNLGHPSLLGSAGPTSLTSRAGLPSGSYYPIGLANTLLGTDHNGGDPEILVNLNSTSNWYVGTSGHPGSQADLYSVALHEIGHGLGFIGSATENPGPGPALKSPPFVFDEAITYNGQPLLGQSNPNSLLQSNNLRIRISDALDQKLYAPGTWQEGNSYSHFDELDNPAGSPGALMTPALQSGETARTLYAPVLGVMDGMGWPMRVGAATPTITGAASSPGAATVNWNQNLGQTAVAPDSYRVEAWHGGTSLAGSVEVSASATSTTVGSLTAGGSYTIKVIPRVDGVDGVAASTSLTLTATPGPPAIVVVSGGGHDQAVSWTAAPGGGVTGYDVERSIDGVNWTTVGSTGGLGLTTTVPEGVHQFRVRGINGYGAGAYGYSIPTGVSAGLIRPVALDGQIGRVYRAYFLREPDGNGFTYWRGQRAGDASLSSISDVFAVSDEFVNRYGPLDNGQFVQLVYQNVLGRPADAPGFSHWTGLLAAGGSRGQVMTGFSESSEYIAKTGTVAPSLSARDQVYRLYVACLLRFPDAAGLDYWSGVRSGGASLESIAASFATSTEFVASYGSLPNDQFVELVYNHVLGRPADGAGFSYWNGQLAAGMDRGAMMAAFSESSEFIVATGTLP